MHGGADLQLQLLDLGVLRRLLLPRLEQLGARLVGVRARATARVGVRIRVGVGVRARGGVGVGVGVRVQFFLIR